MYSTLQRVHSDHDYAAKPGQKPVFRRIKISLEGVLRYIVYKCPKYTLESRTLQTVKWLVVSAPDHNVKASENCKVINPVRLVFEENNDGITVFFQVLFKTKEMTQIHKFEMIDHFLNLIDPNYNYKICPGCLPEHLCEPYPKVLEVCSFFESKVYHHTKCEKWIPNSKVRCTNCKYMGIHMKKRLKRQQTRPDPTHSGNKVPWNSLTNAQKQKRYKHLQIQKNALSKKLKKLRKKYSKLEMYLSEEQTIECSNIINTINKELPSELESLFDEAGKTSNVSEKLREIWKADSEQRKNFWNDVKRNRKL